MPLRVAPTWRAVLLPAVLLAQLGFLAACSGPTVSVASLSAPSTPAAPTSTDSPSAPPGAAPSAPTDGAPNASTAAQPVSVTVSPASVIVQLAGTQQFAAAVAGTSNGAVVWSVNGVPGGTLAQGTISPGGLYLAPPVPPASSTVVTATSVADGSKISTATVALMDPTGGPQPRVVTSLFYDNSTVLFQQDSGGGFDLANWGGGQTAGTGTLIYPGPPGHGNSPAAFGSGSLGYGFIGVNRLFRGHQWYSMKLHVADSSGNLTDDPVLFIGGTPPEQGQVSLPSAAVNAGGPGWYAFKFMFNDDSYRTVRLGVGTNGLYKTGEFITIDKLDCEVMSDGDDVPSEFAPGPENVLYAYANPNSYDPSSYRLVLGTSTSSWSLEPAHALVGIGDSEGYDAYNRFFGQLRHFGKYEVHGMFVPGIGASSFLSYLQTWVGNRSAFGSTAGGASWLPGAQGVFAGGVVPDTLIVSSFVNDINANANSPNWNVGSAAAPSNYDQLTSTVGQIYQLARASGLNNVIFTTTGPFGGSQVQGTNNLAFASAFNAFLLAPGNGWYSVDIYDALEDPLIADQLLPAYDIGDHLHWSDLTRAAWGTGSQVVMTALDVQLQLIQHAVGATARWIKVGRALTYSDFAASSQTDTLQLFLLPQRAFIEAVAISPTVPFFGGNVSAVSLAIGVRGNSSKYAQPYNVAAVTAVSYQQPTTIGPESLTRGTVIYVTAAAAGASLDQLTAGQVDVWAKIGLQF
jgi:hypothetical protein